MTPMPTRPPTNAAMPMQMIMPTTVPPTNAVNPTQMVMTPPPTPDDTMSFDFNRLLDLMHQEEVDVMLADSASSRAQNVRRRRPN